jgi:hypothetical protein
LLLFFQADPAFMFNHDDYAEIVENNGNWNDKPADWAMNAV